PAEGDAEVLKQSILAPQTDEATADGPGAGQYRGIDPSRRGGAPPQGDQGQGGCGPPAAAQPPAGLLGSLGQARLHQVPLLLLTHAHSPLSVSDRRLSIVGCRRSWLVGRRGRCRRGNAAVETPVEQS